MNGLGGVEKVCNGAGGAKGGGYLAGDDAALTDASEDDLTGRYGGQKEVDGQGEGFEERGVEAVGELVECCGFDADETGGAERAGRRSGWVCHELIATVDASRGGARNG